MAQCRNCGYELSPDFKFCPQCATPVRDIPSWLQLPQKPQKPLEKNVDTPITKLSPPSSERELYRTQLSGWESLYPTQSLRVTTKCLILDIDDYLGKHKHWERPLAEIESLKIEVWDPNSRRAQNGCPCSVIVKWKGNPKDYWELDAKIHESYTHGITIDFAGHANEIMEAIQKARQLAGLIS